PGAEKGVFHEHLVPARFVAQRHRDYVFPLETFREYFAGRVVAASSDPYALVKPYLHRPEWRRVILYTAGSLEGAKAPRLALWLPTLTWLFVKGLGPLVRVLAALLGLAAFKKPIEDAGKEAAKELVSLLPGSLERWLARARCSTQYFITAIWKYHCKWPGQRYERILGRDLRLAASCLGVVEGCSEKLATRLVDALAKESLTDTSEGLMDAARSAMARKRVLELTYHRNALLRAAAAKALPEWAAEGNVQERLLALTRKDEELVVRRA